MHSGTHAPTNSTSPRHDPIGPGRSGHTAGASAAGTTGRIEVMPIENPHELLGLVAGEENARVIIEAARSRLVRIREANGSEAAVRAFVIGQICRARAVMLKEARRRNDGRDRGDVRRVSGVAADSAAMPTAAMPRLETTTN